MVVAISWKIRQSRVWKKPIRWPIAVIRRSVTRVQVHWLVRSVVIGRGCLADKLLSKTIISQAERSNWEWNTSTSDIKSIDPVRRTVEEQVSSHAKSISGNSTPRQLDQLLSRVCIFEYLNYRASYNASYKSISHPFRTTLQQLWIFDLLSDGYENDVCVCVCVSLCMWDESRVGHREPGYATLFVLAGWFTASVELFTPFGANSSSFCACKTSARIVWCIRYKCVCACI